MSGIRGFVLLLSALGTLFFGGAFALSLTKPLLIERVAREVLRIEVERQVGERVDMLSDSRIVGLAQRALAQSGVDLRRAQEAIRSELPKRTADAVDRMLDADCECRRRIAASRAESEQQWLGSMLEARDRLDGLIETSYASVRQSLLREFHIFTASNAAAFALLGAITLLRRRASMQLLVPALVLVGAVTITGGLYLFNQDWLHTIVFGQYVGLAYSAYLLLVAAILADLAFNRARVIVHVMNAALNLIGSVASVSPC